MAITARLKCYSVTDHSHNDVVLSKSVKLSPVYDADPASPNYSFSQATPAGDVSLTITNPKAFDQFVEGKVFDVVFTEYQAPPAA